MAKLNQQKTGWHPEDIKAAIRKKGGSLADFSVNYGLSESGLSKALKTPNKAAELAISRLLNVGLHELWPERWTADGKRIYPRYANKYTTKSELVA